MSSYYVYVVRGRAGQHYVGQATTGDRALVHVFGSHSARLEALVDADLQARAWPSLHLVPLVSDDLGDLLVYETTLIWLSQHAGTGSGCVNGNGGSRVARPREPGAWAPCAERQDRSLYDHAVHLCGTAGGTPDAPDWRFVAACAVSGCAATACRATGAAQAGRTWDCRQSHQLRRPGNVPRLVDACNDLPALLSRGQAPSWSPFFPTEAGWPAGMPEHQPGPAWTLEELREHVGRPLLLVNVNGKLLDEDVDSPRPGVRPGLSPGDLWHRAAGYWGSPPRHGDRRAMDRLRDRRGSVALVVTTGRRDRRLVLGCWPGVHLWSTDGKTFATSDLPPDGGIPEDIGPPPATAAFDTGLSGIELTLSGSLSGKGSLFYG